MQQIFRILIELILSRIYLHQQSLYKESSLNYVCIKGKVRLTLFDDRPGSKSKNEIQEIILSPREYNLITIPPNIWNGFKGLDKDESIIANCLTLPHNEKEMVRKSPDDRYFNYKW